MKPFVLMHKRHLAGTPFWLLSERALKGAGTVRMSLQTSESEDSGGLD